MMRRILLTAATVAVLATATAAPVSATESPRPFGGHDRASDTFLPPTTCPAGAVWRYVASGSGVFLHLGLATVSVTHCTFVDFVSGTGTFGPGEIRLTAADGDELRLVEHGTFAVTMTAEGPAIVSEMLWDVSGGTGRFAGAAGHGIAYATSMIVDGQPCGTTTAAYEGEISY